MRIWDIHPGYLNRQSLLGEHRELHGIVSIIRNGKKGYSRHPETMRWFGYEWALGVRHEQLAQEMALRGFTEKSPVSLYENKEQWPEIYIDEPVQQFKILGEKYKGKESGRIPLPQNAQQLWSQHKYSVLARDAAVYKSIGKQLARKISDDEFADMAKILSGQLRIVPAPGKIRNALQHMWGYISEYSKHPKPVVETWSLKEFLSEIQKYVILSNNIYLMESTSLSELAVWI